MEDEFNSVKEILTTQICWSPYDETKKLRLVIDGASSIGVGFVLFQYLSDQNPAKGAVIVSANSSLLGNLRWGILQ